MQSSRQRSARRRGARRTLRPTTRVAILAGGRGTRLAPHTSVLPKPLMPVGGRSILEIIVRQLASQGFTELTLCVGHLSHLIRAVLDTLADQRARISYVYEHGALGTAAPLRLIGPIDDTFITMNGDVLTTLDVRDLLRMHRESGNVLTIATRKRVVEMDYGVLHLDGALSDDLLRRVTGYEEKPEIVTTVSMGIYAIEPRALEYIPESEYFDFPDLVHKLLEAGEQVGAYVYDGLWFDIGRRDDYELAVAAWEENGLVSDEGHGYEQKMAGEDARARAAQ
jgi:NDP-sugar pyrophosphorylase family protein